MSYLIRSFGVLCVIIVLCFTAFQMKGICMCFSWPFYSVCCIVGVSSSNVSMYEAERQPLVAVLCIAHRVMKRKENIWPWAIK